MRPEFREARCVLPARRTPARTLLVKKSMHPPLQVFYSILDWCMFGQYLILLEVAVCEALKGDP